MLPRAAPVKILPVQAVLDYLSQNEARFILELCDYLRFPSVSAQTGHKNDLADDPPLLQIDQEHPAAAGLELGGHGRSGGRVRGSAS